MKLKRSLGLSLFAALLATTAPAADRAGNVTFGLTTTQEASGVSKAILTRLESAFPNLDLSYSVAGTSQQLRSLEDGLIPFAITHNSDKERALVERGGHLRIEVFANDFLLVGPAGHTLECAETEIRQCLAFIARSDMAFLSRGDQSGTNIYELSHWDALGIDPALLPRYTVGSGGAASSLRICAVRECFLIVDASSFAKFDSEDLVEQVKPSVASRILG